MSKLSISRDPFALHSDICPCDIHFTEYLADQKYSSVFHFGTGDHHYVGKTCYERNNGNLVLGITSCPAEIQSYIDLAIENAEFSRNYKVLFGDIYILEMRFLPIFDIVSLFHLYEIPGPSEEYESMDDKEIILMFLDVLAPDGRILFYRGSIGFSKTLVILDALVENDRIVLDSEYKSLVVYKKP